MQYKVKYGAPLNRPNLQTITFNVITFAPAIILYFIAAEGGAILGAIGGFIVAAILTPQGLIIDTDAKMLYVNPKSKIAYLKKEVGLTEIISMTRNFEWGVGKDIQPSYDIQLITRGDPVVISFASKKSVQEFEGKFLTALAEVGNPLN